MQCKKCRVRNQNKKHRIYIGPLVWVALATGGEKEMSALVVHTANCIPVTQIASFSLSLCICVFVYLCICAVHRSD